MTKAAGVQTGVNDITPSQTLQHTVLLSSESGFQSSRCLPRTLLQNVLVFMCHDERTCVFCDPEKCLAEVWFSCSSHYGPLKPDSLMIGVFEPTLPVWQPARPPPTRLRARVCACVHSGLLWLARARLPSRLVLFLNSSLFFTLCAPLLSVVCRLVPSEVLRQQSVPKTQNQYDLTRPEFDICTKPCCDVPVMCVFGCCFYRRVLQSHSCSASRLSIRYHHWD